MAFMNVRGCFIKMERPIQNMNMISEPFIEFPKIFSCYLCENIWRSMLVHVSYLHNAFFRTSAFVFEQIFRTSVSFRVSSFFISCILSVTKIRVPFPIKLSLYFCKRSRKLVIISWDKCFGIISLIAIPIDILFCPFCVNVFALFDVKSAIIVLHIVGSIFA